MDYTKQNKHFFGENIRVSSHSTVHLPYRQFICAK